jgi:adenylosuccinate synthase
VGRVSVVVGGQFGSEGKGAVAGYLSTNKDENVIGVRVAGPNAGHTVYGDGPDGEIGTYAWKLRTVPVTAVTNPDSKIVIAAGSEIEFAVLDDELDRLDRAGYNGTERIIIDDQATVLEDRHKQVEQDADLTALLGSTSKGIGAARADRLLRGASLNGGGVDTAALLAQELKDYNTHVIIEGTQGYGLGLHAGYYPFCTSSDCRAIDFLAMAGVNPWQYGAADVDVWVVARTYPIRVAGNSGPLSNETTWDKLGFEPERTTVTNKIRRVGEWDSELVREAVRANGGAPTVKLALTMFDYVFPELAGATIVPQDQKYWDYIEKIEKETGAKVALVGTSPTTMAYTYH